MNLRHRLVYSFWLLVTAVAIGGCSRAYDATVYGYVSLDGNKITRGTVSFQPAHSGAAAYARIDEDGSYSVRTGREYGLPPGDYEVTVIANEEAQHESVNGGPPPAGKAITPAWYRSKQTSGLRFSVKPGKNEINLDLTSTPPPGYKTAKQK